MSKHPDTKPIDYQYETALLAEEFGEASQIIGKALRFGWESYNPDDVTQETNLSLLTKEVGDVQAAIRFACERKLLSEDAVELRAGKKLKLLREVAPDVMIAGQHLTSTKLQDSGMSAGQERVAGVVTLIFIAILLAATWFGTSYYTGQDFRNGLNGAVQACLTEQIDATALAGEAVAPTASCALIIEQTKSETTPPVAPPE